MTTLPKMTESLDWLAQQYVLGELSSDDAARFESLLAEDAVACEAVATASRLVLSLQALPRPVPQWAPVVAPPNRVGRQLVLVAVSAACVLIVALAWMPSTPTSPDLQVRAEVIQARELVDRWRGGRSYAGPLIAAEEDVDATDLGDAAPNWMLAAVSIEKKPQRDAAREDEVWEDN